jgi:hypothetical protein
MPDHTGGGSFLSLQDSDKILVEGMLSKDSFIMLHRTLLLLLKGEPSSAILLNELVSLSKYYFPNMSADWFFQTVETLEQNLGMNPHSQRRALRILEEYGFINVKYMGMPPKRYIRLVYPAIKKALATEVMPVRLPPSRELASLNKKDFYINLNLNIRKPYEEAKEFLGNIPDDIKQFMYAWTTIMPSDWAWTSQAYGMISTYLKETYGKVKKLDYQSLCVYVETTEVSRARSLPKFIEFDSKRPERLHNEKMSFEEYLTLESGGRSV